MLCDKLGWNIENISNIEDKINNIYIINEYFTRIFSTRIFRFPRQIKDFNQFDTKEDLIISLKFTGFISYHEFFEEYNLSSDLINNYNCDICESCSIQCREVDIHSFKINICLDCLHSKSKIKTWSLKIKPILEDNIFNSNEKVEFVRLIPRTNKLIYFNYWSRPIIALLLSFLRKDNNILLQ